MLDLFTPDEIGTALPLGTREPLNLWDLWVLFCKAHDKTIPDGWRIYEVKSHDGNDAPADYISFRGGVPIGKKRNGRPKWASKAKDPTMRLVWAKHDDMVAWVDDYVHSLGLCEKCLGGGREWRGWSKHSGNRFIPCERCDGTGNYWKAK